MDIGAQEGKNIHAVFDGKVKSLGKSKSFGNFVLYETDNGYEIFCAHMKKILVKEKENIKQNQVIGLIGHTGFASGPHLHYTIKHKDKLINPIGFVNLPLANDF